MGQPPGLGHLLLGQRRSHRGHHIGIAVLVGGNGVHIALDDDQSLLPGRFFCQMQAVEQPALVKNRRAGGVQILGRGAVLQSPTAETAQVALPIANGNHQPAAKGIPIAAAPAFVDNAGLEQLRRGKVLAGQIVKEGLPIRGTEAQLELGDAGRGQAASGQIIPSGRAPVGGQAALEIVPGRLVNAVGDILLLPPLPGGQGYAGLLGQALQGGGELQIFRFHHKGKDIAAARAGPKAMPGLAVGIDIKGRGAFLMKGAVGLEVAPGALQGGIAGDDFRQIQAAFNVVNYRHPSAGKVSRKLGAKGLM